MVWTEGRTTGETGVVYGTVEDAPETKRVSVRRTLSVHRGEKGVEGSCTPVEVRVAWTLE